MPNNRGINTPVCRKCGIELTAENWYASFRKLEYPTYICKECNRERNRLRDHYYHISKPFSENKECPQYLGIYVAERVLSHVFKDVQVMPTNNPGYDVICNQNKWIDIKSACQQNDGKWSFNIKRNTTADFFLCLAFDNREDLNPLHAWLIPGGNVNHLMSAVIRPSTIHKWDEYRLDTSKVSACCNVLRSEVER